MKETRANRKTGRRRRAIVCPRGRAALSLILLLTFTPAHPFALQDSGEAGEPRATRFDPNYSAWQRVLARCATPEGFDYAALKADRSDLARQLAEFGEVSQARFNRFAPRARLAFLINAHNAFAVHRIVINYPVDSIEQTRGLGSALKKRDIYLLGRRWSLEALRREIMDSRYNESRAIFALNWAMRGCAPLASPAVTGANVEALLERQTGRFVRDPARNRYSEEERRYDASDLLRRYRKAIERDFTTLHNFVMRYGPAEDAAPMALHLPRFRFLPFDTSLNDLKRGSSTPDGAKPQ